MKAGKARYIGASSMYAWQFCKALYLADLHGWTRFVSMQNHYNLLYREEEREMMPLCIGPGRRRDPLEPARPRPADAALGQTEARRAGRRRTNSARRCTCGPRTRIARWSSASRRWRHARGVAGRRWRWRGCSGKPYVTSPIVGATKPHHLEDAVAALSLEAERFRGGGAGSAVLAASRVGILVKASPAAEAASPRLFAPGCGRARRTCECPRPARRR